MFPSGVIPIVRRTHTLGRRQEVATPHNAKPHLHRCQLRSSPHQATTANSNEPQEAFGSWAHSGEFGHWRESFHFFGSRSRTEEIFKEDFLLGRNLPSQWRAGCSQGVILQESIFWSLGGLAWVSTHGCAFLPHSGARHFLGTDRNLSLSSVESLTNRSPVSEIMPVRQVAHFSKHTPTLQSDQPESRLRGHWDWERRMEERL